MDAALPGQACLCHQRWARSCPAWSTGAHGAVAGAHAVHLCSASWFPSVSMRVLGTDVQKRSCCHVSLPQPSPGPRPQQGGSRGCPGRTRWRTGPEPGRLTSVQKVTNGGKEARAGPGTRLETSLLESTWAGVAVLLVSCPNGGHSFGLLSVYSPPDRPEPLLGAAPVSSGVGPTRSPCHSCGNRVTGRSLPPGSEPGFEPTSSDCSHVLCPPQPELG